MIFLNNSKKQMQMKRIEATVQVTKLVQFLMRLKTLLEDLPSQKERVEAPEQDKRSDQEEAQVHSQQNTTKLQQ